MANLVIEGTIKQKFNVQTGTSAKGEWAKQDFIVEYKDGNFPAEICFSTWGKDKVADLDKFSIGSEVKVAFSIKAREFNGRWYNDIRTWRIDPLIKDAKNEYEDFSSMPNIDALPPMEEDNPDDLPF